MLIYKLLQRALFLSSCLKRIRTRQHCNKSDVTCNQPLSDKLRSKDMTNYDDTTSDVQFYVIRRYDIINRPVE